MLPHPSRRPRSDGVSGPIFSSYNLNIFGRSRGRGTDTAGLAPIPFGKGFALRRARGLNSGNRRHPVHCDRFQQAAALLRPFPSPDGSHPAPRPRSCPSKSASAQGTEGTVHMLDAPEGIQGNLQFVRRPLISFSNWRKNESGNWVKVSESVKPLNMKIRSLIRDIGLVMEIDR